MLERIEESIGQARTVAIVGHTRPDGDCVGSCLGLYHYLREIAPELQVTVYLEPIHPKFHILEGTDLIQQDTEAVGALDLLYVLDCSGRERIGAGQNLADLADRIVCIDHHLSNEGFGDISHIIPDASSTSEVLFSLMDQKKIRASCAACLYTGIAHDTGVFRHSCTGRSTMEAAGILMEKGAPFTQIILKTFYQKTFAENRMMGAVLSDARLYLDGSVIVGIATGEQMKAYGVTPSQLEGIVDNLNQTEGVLCTVFLYETQPGIYKASLRSGTRVKVSDVAAAFGGGGHMRASGCSIEGKPEQITERLLSEIKKQL